MKEAKTRRMNGFTLIEITFAISILLAMATVTALSATQYQKWMDGKRAADALWQVDAAQRLYFSDYPDDSLASLTQTKLLPYLSGNVWPAMPPVSGSATTINLNASPPVATRGGATYDPSPSPTDGVWDVGK